MAASWESPYPPRTSSRCPLPGIFLNVELSLSFPSQDSRTHTAKMKYASKRMEEKLHQQRIRNQYEEGIYRQQQHPSILLPGNGIHSERQTRHLQQQHRQRRLGVRTTEQHERGTSAPPTILDRTQPISPISPLSPPTRSVAPLEVNTNTGNINTGSLHTSNISPERVNQPLPATPSQYRLGEADMPWSVPPWYRPPEPEFAGVASPAAAREQENQRENRRFDDPQRVKDLETLHQAMMTVDSLNNDGWESWTWESVGDMPRGPRSIGWAVSSNDASSRLPNSPPGPLPPPYVVSQWEQSFGWNHFDGRPRTSGT